jgi:hypothetical protein
MRKWHTGSLDRTPLRRPNGRHRAGYRPVRGNPPVHPLAGPANPGPPGPGGLAAAWRARLGAGWLAMGGWGVYAHRIGQDQQRGALRLPEGRADPNLDDPTEPDRSLDAEVMEGGNKAADLVLIRKNRAILPAPILSLGMVAVGRDNGRQCALFWLARRLRQSSTRLRQSSLPSVPGCCGLGVRSSGYRVRVRAGRIRS